MNLHIFIKSVSRYFIIFSASVKQIIFAITFSNWFLLEIGRSIVFCCFYLVSEYQAALLVF